MESVDRDGDYMNGKIESELRQQVRAEEIWLNYFNRYLYKHGTITKREYLRMSEAIIKRTAKRCRECNVSY